uniref:Ig-like domain-containing protein n=1 Tax=Ornithorhynchus anatinus TaxID=9258 RepID=A0A6I8PPA0_ORNAN
MSLHFFLSWTLMLIITDPSVSKKIVYSVGDNAILPCSYLVQNSDDLTSVCWGRGECSLTGCGDTIVTTDGKKMTFSRSDRYNLKGNLFRGHVSLTITGVTKADSGMYCCRVEIAGWFNDEKNNLELEIWPGNLQNGGKLQNLSAISKFNPQHPRTQLAMEERPYTEENIYSIEENAYEIEDG